MINIVKIGGNIINDENRLKNFLQDFSKIPGKKILVHGGGKEATELGKRLGVVAPMVNGRRVTDRETLDIVTMTYAGLINKRIVALLQDFGCNAVGLTGADGHLIPAKKRNPKPVDFGYVGDIDPKDINTFFLSMLLNVFTTPVFCAICYEPHGTLLNCNADSVASALAVACTQAEYQEDEDQDVVLTYCFEKPGVLRDVNDESSMIPVIYPSQFGHLVEKGIISEGMIPKIHNSFEAVVKGVAKVRICSAENLLSEKGTILCLPPDERD